MIKAVIFDMDGVIAMTSYIHANAESKVFAEIGIYITPEEILKKYSGFKDIDMFKDALQQNKNNTDPKKLQEKKWELVYHEIKKKDIVQVTGAIDFIKKLLSAGYILGLGSATNLKFIQTVLTRLKITEKFKAITSGDETISGKPNPQIFLLTATNLSFLHLNV